MEENTSVYQGNPVSRISGEGRAEILRAWGPGFEQRGSGGGGRKRAGQLNLCAETINPSFKGTNLTVVEGMHQFIMYIL